MPKSRHFLLFFSALFFGITILYLNLLQPKKDNLITSPDQSLFPIPIKHYRVSDVQLGLTRYPPQNPVSTSTRLIRGGVVPHHLVAQLPLASYFQNLGKHKYTKVILLGPNHDDLGNSPIVSSLNPWETPYGLVHVATNDIQAMNSCLTLDGGISSHEHSLAVLMPFIKSYLPGSVVIPLHLKREISEQSLDFLVACLLPHIDEDTLILASIDFSHYLLSEDAALKDNETLGLIKQYNYERILSLTPSHLDSPTSLVVFLKVMQKLGTTTLEVANHTDAAVLTNLVHKATTTHYYLNYYAQ